MVEASSKRGRTHNAEGAREAILNAAEQVFAEHGFDGTRVDTIAEVAGYNKSLIFQYFGDKLKLYESVIRRADGQISAFQNQAVAGLLQESVIQDGEQLQSLLRTFIGGYFDYLVEHPRFVRILNWEMAEGWQTYAQITSERDQEDMASLNTVMQTVKDAGWLRSDFDMTAQVITALFTSQIYLGLVPLLRVYLPQSTEDVAQARAFIVAFITHGLMADVSQRNV